MTFPKSQHYYLYRQMKKVIDAITILFLAIFTATAVKNTALLPTGSVFRLLFTIYSTATNAPFIHTSHYAKNTLFLAIRQH